MGGIGSARLNTHPQHTQRPDDPKELQKGAGTDTTPASLDGWDLGDEPASFPGMRTRFSLRDERGRRFDVAVGNNQAAKADKGTSMAAYAMSNGVGGYIDNEGKNNILFYYDVSRAPEQIKYFSKAYVIKNKSKVHIFLPLEYFPDVNGNRRINPNAENINEILGPITASLRSKGVEVYFHPYEGIQSGRDDHHYHGQGTAWVNKEGGLYLEGSPVK